jgi:transposase
MPAHFRLSSLIPSGLVVESVMQADDMLVVTARAGIQVAMCPLCRSPSRGVHSRYVRQVSDLPCSGRSVCLRVVARRFCCEAPHCRRRIFAERFDEAVLLVRSRRTWRLDRISSIILAWLSAAGRQRASPSA